MAGGSSLKSNFLLAFLHTAVTVYLKSILGLQGKLLKTVTSAHTCILLFAQCRLYQTKPISH